MIKEAMVVTGTKQVAAVLLLEPLLLLPNWMIHLQRISAKFPRKTRYKVGVAIMILL
mgnify:CR=1 FL=1